MNKSSHLQMLGQMVGAREALIAHPALVRLDAGVAAPVPRQLVRPAEPPGAATPGAGEGLLPCVPPQVRLAIIELIYLIIIYYLIK